MVFVEIAIVVLGILIAFQLDRYGDWRQARRDEQQLMGQIAEEATDGARALRFFGDQHRESAVNFRLLTDAVHDPGAARRYAERGEAGCNLLRLPAVQRQSAGAIAQAVGPRIELIRDSRLRELLRSAESDRQFAERQLEFFRANFLIYGETIEPHMDWSFTGKDEETHCTVDLHTLASDTKAIALLPKLARDHLRFASYRDGEQRDLEMVVKRIQCLQSRQCKPDL